MCSRCPFQQHKKRLELKEQDTNIAKPASNTRSRHKIKSSNVIRKSQ